MKTNLSSYFCVLMFASLLGFTGCSRSTKTEANSQEREQKLETGDQRVADPKKTDEQEGKYQALLKTAEELEKNLEQNGVAFQVNKGAVLLSGKRGTSVLFSKVPSLLSLKGGDVDEIAKQELQTVRQMHALYLALAELHQFKDRIEDVEVLKLKQQHLFSYGAKYWVTASKISLEKSTQKIKQLGLVELGQVTLPGGQRSERFRFNGSDVPALIEALNSHVRLMKTVEMFFDPSKLISSKQLTSEVEEPLSADRSGESFDRLDPGIVDGTVIKKLKNEASSYEKLSAELSGSMTAAEVQTLVLGRNLEAVKSSRVLAVSKLEGFGYKFTFREGKLELDSEFLRQYLLAHRFERENALGKAYAFRGLFHILKTEIATRETAKVKADEEARYLSQLKAAVVALGREAEKSVDIEPWHWDRSDFYAE